MRWQVGQLPPTPCRVGFWLSLSLLNSLPTPTGDIRAFCSPFLTPGNGTATPFSSPASWSISARLPNSVIFLRFKNS